MNLRKVFFVGLILVLFGFGALNIFAIETVEVDLKELKFNNPLPFDVPFELKGAINGQDVVRIAVKYTILNPKPKAHYNYPEGTEIERYDLAQTFLMGEKIPEKKKSRKNGITYIFAKRGEIEITQEDLLNVKSLDKDTLDGTNEGIRKYKLSESPLKNQQLSKSKIIKINCTKYIYVRREVIQQKLKRLIDIEKVQEKEKKGKLYFYIYSKKMEWEREGDGQLNFYFKGDDKRIGPLHPNINYKFEFEIHRKLNREQFVKEILTKLETILKTEKSVTIAAFIKKLENVEKDIRDYINDKNPGYYDKKGKPIPPPMLDDDFNDFYENMVEQRRLYEAIYENNIPNLKKLFTEALYSEFKLHKKLYEMLSSPGKFDAATKINWDKPLFNQMKKYETVTMADVASIFANALQTNIDGSINNKSIEKILEGKARIEGSSIFPSESLDIDTIKLLLEFIKKIKSPSSKYEGKTLSEIFDSYKVHPKNVKSITQIFSGITKNIEAVLERLNSIEIKKEEFEALVNNFYKKFSEKYSKVEKIRLVEVAVVDKYKNYIALDFGAGYAFRIDRPFLYVGANIYAVPINKEASLPFLRLRGRHWFWKRTSLLLGITTSMGIENGNSKNLFAKSSLLIGAGFRLLKSIKINSGVLLFKQIDENPIVDSEYIKLTPFLSGSFDIDIKEVLGKVGEALF